MQLTRLKALTQLGFRQTSLFAWYQWGLKSGYLRWRTKTPSRLPGARLELAIPLPEPGRLRKVLGDEGLSLLYAEAKEILSGRVRLFGGGPVDLDLSPPSPLRHWTHYQETSPEEQKDIKLIWEPGRFGWAITLARAYFLSQDERFAEAFWKYTEFFLDSNPAYLGLHWVSAQEAALRLTSLVFAYQIFAASPLSTPGRTSRLAESIAQHAARIPPTLAYARAQNNNHLLTESMGLITAATALPAHPSARKWHTLGWKWFHQGLQAQIAEDGTYTQHSTNYHRLMLQAALWVYLLSQSSGESFPEGSLSRLAAATRWLQSLLDPVSGGVPNLGPNDGAYIFPLSVLPFQNFRSILQAAGRTFLGERVLPEGMWDEMSLWLCPKSLPAAPLLKGEGVGDQGGRVLVSDDVSHPILHSANSDSWAYLRVARFTSRPGHADQLHLDLWWRGLNIALDPGTYLYNAPAPWDNTLTSTLVHNTVAINGQEQMRRAGRFLYLDWAQGKSLAHELAGDGSLTKLVAHHNGYRRLGIIHQRTVEAMLDGWQIEDQLLPATGKPDRGPIQARLHWLLPDWEWRIKNVKTQAILELLSPYGWINLKIQGEHHSLKPEIAHNFSIELVRAGKTIAPQERDFDATNPTWGWVSPTYGVKYPGLSFLVKMSGSLPLTFTTKWELTTQSLIC